MNLLVFNLAMDADDAVHGHTTDWTNALARRCEHVSVITMRAGRLDVEPNVSVHSLGKECGYSEPRRLARFYRLSRSVIAEQRIDACFAHMAPLFTVLFAPQARLRKIPVLLWYAHASVTRTLRLAHVAADRCVSSTPAGFRIPSRKLFIVGQGVDVDHIRPPLNPAGGYERTVISVGRMTPVKRIDVMIEAIATLRDRGVDVSLKLYGPEHADGDTRYASSLRRLVEDRELGNQVTFEGAMPFHEIQSAYHAGSIFLNLSNTGSIDKAILESMAAGCIPISANASFANLAREHGRGELVAFPDAAPVADRIQQVLDTAPGERERLRSQLREIVVDEHSLDRLTGVLACHLSEISKQRSLN